MISFLNLQYFLLLSEELNFNNTAKKLHVTQQTLSGHIKKMEHSLGVKLFNYGPPLEITPAGLLLKTHAEILLNQKKKNGDGYCQIQDIPKRFTETWLYVFTGSIHDASNYPRLPAKIPSCPVSDVRREYAGNRGFVAQEAFGCHHRLYPGNTKRDHQPPAL